MNYKEDFPILNNRDIAYLDSGATTQKPIQVIKEVEKFYGKKDILYTPLLRKLKMKLYKC